MRNLRIEHHGPLATLRLDKGRGNAIDEPLAEELAQAADELHRDDAVRGVLLASAHPKIFCPGLDLTDLVDYDRPAMERFLRKFAEALWALYSLPKPVVAALAGHAVAGGAVLALTADYRILRRGGVRIGLNEIKVGVPLPWSVSLLLRATVAPSALARTALLGSNFADDEAVGAGLADELADADGFEETCRARLDEFAEKDELAFGLTKTYLRADTLRLMKEHEAARAAEFLDAWFQPATRDRIRRIATSLGSRRAEEP